MKRQTIGVALILAFAAVTSAHAAVQTVLSNNGAPGDDFTFSGGSPGGSQAIGATGWYYANVRVDGHAGINVALPRSGNGSALLSTSGNGSSKADVEYYGALGTLGQLSTLSYDWYRASGGSAANHLHASLRLFYDADGNLGTTGDRGSLVYEQVYNGGAVGTPVTTDAWVTSVIGQTTNLWMTYVGSPLLEIYNRTLNDWINTPNPNGAYPTLSADTLIIGLSSGVGSGWGSYEGAVDNITIGFGTPEATTYNFEVRSDGVVPEPMTLAVWSLLGACGAAIAWRTRRATED